MTPSMIPSPAILGRAIPPRIYLDHAATTPMLPAARAAMVAGLENWANPSSPHREGRAARAALERARDAIRAALGWRHELIFTGGATEAAAIVLTRAEAAGPILVSAVEHLAVLRPRADTARVAVDAAGLVDPSAFAGAGLAAVQQVNSETGVLQPIDAVRAQVAANGGLLFVDAAQGAGKLPLPDADMIAVSAHKVGGPPGIGALLVRDLAMLAPDGPGQERGYRPGTENLPAILGFAAALEEGGGWFAAQAAWRAMLDTAVRQASGVVVCDDAPRSPAIASYRMPGVTAEAMLIRLDMAGFAVSAGSACSSGSLHPSHVMTAIGLDDAAARETIRVSFGPTTVAEDVAAVARAFTSIAEAARVRAA